MQFKCKKYLVCLVIYKIFLYPLGVKKISVLFGSPVPMAINSFFFFPPNFADSHNRLQIWNLKFWGSIFMTEMESPLEDYATGWDSILKVILFGDCYTDGLEIL